MFVRDEFFFLERGGGVTAMTNLVFKLGAVDGLASSAVEIGKIATLDHKVLDDPGEAWF